MPSSPTPEMIARAQRILDQKPEGIGFDFSEQGDFMRRIAAREGVTHGMVSRVWRRRVYSYLRRAGQVRP